MNPILIIDFDSTFIQDETLDEIANLVADNNQKKEIKNITNQAMEGKIDFGQALKKRVEMLKIHKRDIENIIKILEKRV
jgi:D-3-phosphoglycerate dehydrogenase